MTTKITILGAGPGGYLGAIKAAQLGAEVTVIERDAVGGTCLNRGCIPTKALKSSADALDAANRLAEYGVVLEGTVRPDMQLMMARKNKVVSTMVKAIEGLFKQYKIQLIRGAGRVISPEQVEVTQSDENKITVVGDKLVLGTGSEVLNMPMFPLDGQTIISSDDALQLQEIPKDLLIIGGGVMGVEFASIFRSLGSQVTVVEALDRLIPIPNVDEDSSKLLRREFKKRKLNFYLNKTVVRSEKTTDGKIKAVIGPSPFLAELTEKDKKEIEIVVDKILVTIGRKYNSAGIGLEELGMEVSEQGWIPVNNKMETNIKNVYAIGDLLGPEKWMLAHVASVEAQIAVENCMGADKAMDYSVVPAGIFTTPEVGNVGISEKQAQESGLKYRADSFQFRALGKAQAIGEIAGEVKMISDQQTGKIIGVHIIGPHATDLVAEAALAMKLGATAKDMAETIHLHPSLSEGLMETSHGALDECLHLPPVNK